MSSIQSDRCPKQEEEEGKEVGATDGEDPIQQLVRLVVQTLLREEGFQVWSDMVEYRKNLSRRLLERLPDLEGQPVDVTRFYASFKAGWQEWKKKGPQHEESSFEMFMQAMNVDLTPSSKKGD